MDRLATPLVGGVTGSNRSNISLACEGFGCDDSEGLLVVVVVVFVVIVGVDEENVLLDGVNSIVLFVLGLFVVG